MCHFFVFRNSVDTLCVSWAFSLVECVTVWTLKLPVPHTDVLKTHESQSVSTKLLESKRIGSEHLTQTLTNIHFTFSVQRQFIGNNFFYLILLKRLHYLPHPQKTFQTTNFCNLVIGSLLGRGRNLSKKGLRFVSTNTWVSGIAYFACRYPYAFVKRERPRSTNFS